MVTSHYIAIQDWHPTPVNKLLSGHWSKGHKLKKLDREYIAIAAKAIPQAMRKRQVILTIYLGKGQRGCDPDAYWKSTLDALVHAGLLKDDSPKYCELMPVRYDRHDDRQKETVIELIDVDDEPKRKRAGWR